MAAIERPHRNSIGADFFTGFQTVVTAIQDDKIVLDRTK